MVVSAYTHTLGPESNCKFEANLSYGEFQAHQSYRVRLCLREHKYSVID